MRFGLEFATRASREGASWNDRSGHWPALSAGVLVLSLSGAMAVSGCGRTGDESALKKPSLEIALDPEPPRVGENEISLVFSETTGEPLEGASVRIEGNMNHAGMVPVFADASEDEPGHYTARLEFTMGGDWILSVDATASDGRTFSWREDVRGVRPD